MATGEDQRGKTDFAQLFTGFEDVALGPLESRIGCVLPFADVRDGIEKLAQDVIAKLQQVGSPVSSGSVAKIATAASRNLVCSTVREVKFPRLNLSSDSRSRLNT